MSLAKSHPEPEERLRPISKTDAIVYPEAFRKFIAEKLEPLPDVRMPDVVCPECRSAIEIRFGRSTQQYLGSHPYRPACALNNRMFFRLGIDRAQAVAALRGLLVAENL